ncbi:MAG: protein translocase subunit SecD [Microlunatus sp.]|nr:protein translocase subunit SecD [Microlunatus sp.]MDN5804512.1 protein translocase subunit SecD [Microlunatus sp.]
MATRGGHPGRTLIILGLVVAALYGLMAISNNWSPKLGLDLQGGTTITLTAQNTDGTGQIDPNSLQLARTIIQSRVDSLGVGESEVTTSGDRQITVAVPNVQQDELVRLVGQTAVLRFRAVYGAEGVAPAVTEPPTPEPGASPSTPASPQPSASPSGDRRPAPQLPTAPPAPNTPKPTAPGQGTPPDKAIEWQPSEADRADFAAFTCDQDDAYPDVSDQPLVACNREKTEKYLLGPTLIEGTDLTTAAAGVPQNQVQWVVNLEFNGDGAAAFESATGTLATRQPPENQFAIVLDSEVISAPSVSGAIPGGRAEISGNFNQQSATELANILKYGALPLAFEVSEVSNVSATLGGEQLRAGIIAGIVGLALVVGFCFWYYRGLGLVVVSSLAVAGLTTYAAVVLLGDSVGFALNLPGIAGVIVAIGVTADSFVIYFERIRDEVRDGRSLRTAIETGWLRARQTVLIADAVSMMSALILFILAIGSVKGFAFTLGLTTIIDVAVVFFFTKPLMTVLGRTRFFGQGHRYSGLDPDHLGVKVLPGMRSRAPGASKATGRPATESEVV